MVPGKVLLEVILGKQLGIKRLLERRHLIGLGRGGKARGVNARGLGSLLDFNVGVIMLVVVVGVLGLWVGGWDEGRNMSRILSDQIIYIYDIYKYMYMYSGRHDKKPLQGKGGMKA